MAGSPIVLVGGATGLIGDPRQSSERKLNSKDVVERWVKSIQRQIGNIVTTDWDNPARFVSNYEWTSKMSVIDFLRDVGKNFRLSSMLPEGHRRAQIEVRRGHLVHRVQLPGPARERFPPLVQ